LELVIASQNSCKVYELRQILKSCAPQIAVLSLFDFPGFTMSCPKEASFEENAKNKALKAALALGKVVLADDSGIVIPALGKESEALARRYQQEENSTIEQTRKLLDEMKNLRDIERHAYLECALAIAKPDGTVKCSSHRTEGYIADEERGKIQFEFDTIFIKHDYRKTIGELPPSIQARISHRRRALEKLLPTIESFLKSV
jgi:XTP/dITP diphosphohydrolase